MHFLPFFVQTWISASSLRTAQAKAVSPAALSFILPLHSRVYIMKGEASTYIMVPCPGVLVVFISYSSALLGEPFKNKHADAHFFILAVLRIRFGIHELSSHP